MILSLASIPFVLELVPGRMKLASERAKLEEAGESLNWQEVAPLPGTKLSNGAAAFLAAIDAVPKPPRGLLTPKMTEQGAVVPVTRYEDTPARIWRYDEELVRTEEWTTNIWNIIQPLIVQGQTNWFHARRAATNQTIVLDLDWSEGSYLKLPHLSGIKDLAIWIRLAVMQDLHRREIDLAVEKLIIGYQLLLAYEEPILVSALVRQAAAHHLADATWELLQHGGWNPERLKVLQDSIDSVRFVEVMDRGLRMARSSDFTIWRRCLSDFAPLRESWIFRDDTQADSFWNSPFMWWSCSARADLAWYLRRFRTQFEKLRSSWKLQSFARYQSIVLKESEVPDTLLFSRTFNPGVRQSGERVFLAETRRELVVTAIALRRYHRANGDYPDSLEELIPKYLNDHPIDWMGGSPLAYSPDGDDRFRLWSVGLNGKDDGGDSRSDDTLKPSISYDGRDWVWPVAASPSEAKQYIVARLAEMGHK